MNYFSKRNQQTKKENVKQRDEYLFFNGDQRIDILAITGCYLQTVCGNFEIKFPTK